MDQSISMAVAVSLQGRLGQETINPRDTGSSVLLSKDIITESRKPGSYPLIPKRIR